MSSDEWLIARLLARLAFPLFLVVVFGLLWLGSSRCTARTWIKLSTAVTGTVLVAVGVFLIAWEQASGS